MPIRSILKGHAALVAGMGVNMRACLSTMVISSLQCPTRASSVLAGIVLYAAIRYPVKPHHATTLSISWVPAVLFVPTNVFMMASSTIVEMSG